jgi:DNA-binding NtrC family response regulator
MMQTHILKGKKILIVDDEPDILETLTDLLDMCIAETINDFDTAAHLLEKTPYDAAILDIMGVNGYGLLEIANQNNIPALMLTAHALTADNLVASIKGGAYAYIPKDEMVDIEEHLIDLLKSKEKNRKPHGWYKKLLPFFNNRFGENWKEKDPEFWMDFDRALEHSKEELEKVLR